MSDKVIVMVSDLDDGVHGEINILEGPEQAARFVETLIESGFEQERIRVFVGDEMMMEVHHRPVVSLNTPSNIRRTSKEDAPQDAQEDVEAREGEVAGAKSVVAAGQVKSLHVEEVNAVPMIKNGVRFSSMFRPA